MNAWVHGNLEIESSSAVLRVEAEDETGNRATCTVDLRSPGPGSVSTQPRHLDSALPWGDVTLDAAITVSDAAAIRRHLADPVGRPLSLEGKARCSVIGRATDCDVRDVVVLRRQLEPAPLPPAIQPVCGSVGG